jgi:catechol 2,3-dioxygenase-like lactoylglutathione lyase family enzyme
MIRGVSHVGINTSNLDRLGAFYTEVLGFDNAADEVSWRNHSGLDAVLGLTGSAARQRNACGS